MDRRKLAINFINSCASSLLVIVNTETLCISGWASGCAGFRKSRIPQQLARVLCTVSFNQHRRGSWTYRGKRGKENKVAGDNAKEGFDLLLVRNNNITGWKSFNPILTVRDAIGNVCGCDDPASVAVVASIQKIIETKVEEMSKRQQNPIQFLSILNCNSLSIKTSQELCLPHFFVAIIIMIRI